eukprot:5923292-Amphidinium_carterae.1
MPIPGSSKEGTLPSLLSKALKTVAVYSLGESRGPTRQPRQRFSRGPPFPPENQEPAHPTHRGVDLEKMLEWPSSLLNTQATTMLERLHGFLGIGLGNLGALSKPFGLMTCIGCSI